MKMWTVRGAIVAIAAGAAACGGTARPVTTPAPAPSSDDRTITVRLGTGQVVTLAIDEYVRGSILAELAPGGSDPESALRAFEVQAILARTYALASRGRHTADGFDVCATTHCQLVDFERASRSRWRDIAAMAVDETRGQVLEFESRPALTLYHADCGGHRSAAGEVWGGRDRPYLAGGPDDLPQGFTHRTWRFAVDRAKLRDALARDRRTNPGSSLVRVEVHSRDGAGRAALVLITGERSPVVRGEEFRMAMARAFGVSVFPSSRFDVSQHGDEIVFEGTGFGHGVGLCQRGALARANAGDSPEEILEFYFPGTAVRNRFAKQGFGTRQ
jgi:stage II sporulation protein D